MSESPETATGGKLLSTMAELRQQIEMATQASPQRLKLAQAYLDSLAWGISGLAALGHKVGFQLLEPNPPREYPKMLYKGPDYQIAKTPQDEQLLLSDGYSSRVSIPSPPPEPAERPPPPTISISLPKPPAKELPDGPDEDADPPSGEVP